MESNITMLLGFSSAVLTLLNVVLGWSVVRFIRILDENTSRIFELEKWRTAELAVQEERDKRNTEATNKILTEITDSLFKLSTKK